MKYTKQEQVQQILLRGRQLRQKKAQRTRRGLAALSSALLCALVSLITLFGKGGVAKPGTVYGAFLLSAEVGGYVLVAILAFVTGVVVAVMIHKHRNKEGKEPDR